ncbi:MAG: hypothetical protein NC187_08885 [Candidatus Amulumruptor caecigallinarius]|nr:hypothetical protein [Candidatus Amulumruptor caecigallinarius]MCM1397582.1 hypothetical protein [Candidatus Amulumruptor caecigallinarius]MCM1453952.1 hypothetical protein [bacterium]
MSLINRKPSTSSEIEVLERLEQQLKMREKRQRVQKFIIGGLACLVAISYVTGHCVGHKTAKKSSLW